MEIREARAEDLSSLERIEQSSFQEKRFDQRLLRAMILEETFLTLMAMDGAEVLGYGSAHFEGDGPCRIVSIAVLPEARGKGVGRLILQELEVRCVGKGTSRFCLEVGVSNLLALRLYISHGYEVKGIIRDYYGKGTDAFYMERELRK